MNMGQLGEQDEKTLSAMDDERKKAVQNVKSILNKKKWNSEELDEIFLECQYGGEDGYM